MRVASSALLLLAASGTADPCKRGDVDRSESGIWSFDLAECTELNLGGGAITDEGAGALAEELKDNDALTVLNLWSTSIR